MKRWLALLLLGAPLLAQEGQIPTGGNAGVTAIPFATAPLNPAAIVGADFTCASTTPVKNVNVTCTDASTGTPTSWLWSFGDGATSTSQNPVHAYADPGTYSVSLTATNRGGSNAKLRSGYIVVSDVIAPVAAFSGTPLSGTAALSVTFTDASTNTPTSWAWDFGDGVGTSSAQNPTYAYPVSGTFTVTLTATNAAGSDAEVKVGYVSVSSSLLSGLTHRWSLDETSGTRADSVGGVSLTDNNTVGYAAGFSAGSGNAASFVEGNSEVLSATLPASVSGNMTFVFWMKPHIVPAAHYSFAVALYDVWSANISMIALQQASQISSFCGNGATTVEGVKAGLAQDVWQLVVTQFDNTTKKTTVYINNVAGTPSAALGGVHYASVGFAIGGPRGGAPAGTYSTTDIDEPLVYNRLLTSAEMTRLAAGAVWPFTGLP